MIGSRWFEFQRAWLMLRDAASVLGFFAIIITIVEFFPSFSSLSQVLQQGSVFALVFLVSLLYAIANNRPKNSFLFNINGRDVELELRIGDMSELHGALIVPVNSEFDVYLNGSVTSARSVKAMVIDKYFGRDFGNLKKMIQRELKKTIYIPQKDGDRYKMGTTVCVETSDKSRRFYFVANSLKMNDRRVKATESDFYDTLSGLWAYITAHGAKENIAIPLLGTGNGRLSLPRQEVYKEIVRSFIAACSGGAFCNKLTIVIRREDVRKCNIDINTLVEFTKLHTRYADFTVSDTKQAGVAIG